MISVLTVNYRSAADVAGLADSLRRHRGDEAIELMIVNHSPAEPIELPAEVRSFTRVISQPNAGFAAGVNAAYRASVGDVVFVANPDLRLRAGTLRVVREALERDPSIGVLLPLLRDPGGAVQASVRRFYTWRVALYARSPLRWLGVRPRFFREYLYEGLDRSGPVEVDWGLGGAMFLRRRDGGPDGIFDPRFFLYFEDVDLCFRTWQSGRRVVYCPQVECIHAHRRGSAVPFGRHGGHHLVSLLRFVQKHGGLPGRPGPFRG